MITSEEVLRMQPFVDEILDVIEQRDAYTQSDLQGRVAAIVLQIFRAAEER